MPDFFYEIPERRARHPKRDLKGLSKNGRRVQRLTRTLHAEFDKATFSFIGVIIVCLASIALFLGSIAYVLLSSEVAYEIFIFIAPMALLGSIQLYNYKQCKKTVARLERELEDATKKLDEDKSQSKESEASQAEG